MKDMRKGARINCVLAPFTSPTAVPDRSGVVECLDALCDHAPVSLEGWLLVLWNHPLPVTEEHRHWLSEDHSGVFEYIRQKITWPHASGRTVEVDRVVLGGAEDLVSGEFQLAL